MSVALVISVHCVETVEEMKELLETVGEIKELRETVGEMKDLQCRKSVHA